MASPVVLAVSEAFANFTSLDIPTPTGTSTGDLLLVVVAVDDAITTTSMVGFTELYQEVSETFITGSAYYRIADGAEGANLTVTLSGANEVSGRAYRISDYSGVPEFQVASTGNSTTQTSPPITPAGGSADYLYLVFDHIDTNNASINTFPTGYVNTGSIASTRCRLGYGEKPTLATTSETPANWILSATRRTVTSTIAISSVVSSGITLTAALGSINYASQNTTVQLSGVVDVNATLGSIDYSSNGAEVQISGNVDVVATLGVISYNSQNTNVQLSGAVNVSVTLGAIDYGSLNTVIQLSGEVGVNAALGLIDYSSNNAVIGITGGISLSATLGQIDYSSKNASITLQGQINTPVTLGHISYDSNNVVIGTGDEQIIGVVTVGFAADIYGAGFKPDEITVTFKI